MNEISQTEVVGLDRECRLFLFCKETVKALRIFFLHLLPFVGDAQISYTHSNCRLSSLGLNPSVEDGCKVGGVRGKIQILCI